MRASSSKEAGISPRTTPGKYSAMVISCTSVPFHTFSLMALSFSPAAAVVSPLSACGCAEGAAAAASFVVSQGIPKSSVSASTAAMRLSFMEKPPFRVSSRFHSMHGSSET